MRLMAPIEDPIEEGVIDINEEEEVEKLNVSPDPGQPSAEQIEEHRVCGHTPYRSWCKFCVMGRGLGEQHRSKPGSTIPRIGSDHFYITKGCVKTRQELEYPNNPEESIAMDEDRKKGTIVKCLIVRDLESKNVFCHVVPFKGTDEDFFTAGMAADDIKWLGYSRVILKSDNEVALKALEGQIRFLLNQTGQKIEQVSEEEAARHAKRQFLWRVLCADL